MMTMMTITKVINNYIKHALQHTNYVYDPYGSLWWHKVQLHGTHDRNRIPSLDGNRDSLHKVGQLGLTLGVGQLVSRYISEAPTKFLEEGMSLWAKHASGLHSNRNKTICPTEIAVSLQLLRFCMGGCAPWL